MTRIASIIDDGVPLEDEYSSDPELRPGSEFDDEFAYKAEQPWLESDAEVLAHTQECLRSGRQWFDAATRKRIESAWSRFRSNHPAGSKFNTELFSKRSRTFHPQTKSKMRKLEAAMAAAFFQTQDVVHCSAVNESDEDQRDAAELQNGLLNYRLVTQPKMKQGGIPWFQIVIGGAQCAFNTGIVFSCQTWRYERRKRAYIETYRDPTSGEFLTRDAERDEVISDQPDVRLIPIENMMISPASDWLDPINSSPYVIEMRPLFADEVRRRMGAVNQSTGKTEYRPIDDGLLKAYTLADWDSIRQAREGHRADKYATEALGPYDVVWVYHCIVRADDGCDYVYDTLGEHIMLSWEPRPIEQVYLHGIRPYSCGIAAIEAHNLFPEGPNDHMKELQDQSNDVKNLRLDNLKLSVNTRYVLRRGAAVNAQALMRNVPSGVLMADKPDTDIRVLEQREIPQSAYAETDRIDLEADEITGNLSQSTIGSTRQLGNTVGGMNLLATDANEVKEYVVRTVAETWVEDVLRQIVLLNSAYETSATVLAIAGSRAGIDVARAVKLLRQPVMLTANVGFGATNPQKRIEKLAIGLKTLASVAPELLQSVDRREVVKEIFGALGYKDGARFFPNLFDGKTDPQVAALQRQVQQLQQLVQGKQLEMQARIQIAQIGAQAGLDGKYIEQQTQIYLAQLKAGGEQARGEAEHRMKELTALLTAEQNDIKRRQLMLERESLSHAILQADREFQLQVSGARTAELSGTEAEDLGGNDKAGTLSRNDYGMLPESITAA